MICLYFLSTWCIRQWIQGVSSCVLCKIAFSIALKISLPIAFLAIKIGNMFAAESVKKMATKKTLESAVQNHVDGDDSPLFNLLVRYSWTLGKYQYLTIAISWFYRQGRIMSFSLGFQFTWSSIPSIATSNMLAVLKLSMVGIGTHYLPFQIGLVLVKSSGASSFGVPRKCGKSRKMA